jgi:HAD superfamily hydrolase (TIGR01509 family)
LKALIWDVDGTIAETERDGHRVAFNRAFEAMGLPWHWDVEYYGQLLVVTGGRERLLFAMQAMDDAPTDADEREKLASALHRTKNELYAGLVQEGRIAWREGVQELMEQCRSHGLPMAIATTTSRANVDALLSARLGRAWCEWFRIVVCGEDVSRKKPDPEVYLLAIDGLGITPDDAVAIEDSPQGAAAAHAAGVAAILTGSTYFPATEMANAIAIGPGLHRREGWRPALPHASSERAAVGLTDIARWHAAHSCRRECRA